MKRSASAQLKPASQARAKDRENPANPERDERPGGGFKGHGLKLGDRKLTDAAVLEALRATFGIRAAAARRLNCSVPTLYAFLRERPHLAEQIHELGEEVGDIVEGKLLAAIQRGDIRAITFYCSTKLKARGYTTRIKQTGFDGGPILVETSPPSIDEMNALLDRLAAEHEARERNLQ